jgi:hypothetical protein
MAKFVLVNKEPEVLDDGCIIIKKPDFHTEIEQCLRKKPKSKTATVNYLREIVATIGLKYAPETFNPLSDVNLALFKGVPCETMEQTQNIIAKAFRKSYPEIFDLYVDYHIKHRPNGTKLVYFLGDFNQSSAFTRHGFDALKPKEVDVYLGKKTKKVVGKPAITNKAAAEK